MDKKNLSTEETKKMKKRFRKIGKILLTFGIIFSVTGLISFFIAMSSFGSPTLFFLCFIGFPMIAVGITLLRMGYIGEMARYTSSEVSPVAKDTINYILDGTSESINNVVHKEGKVQCPNCHEMNDKDAKFCDNCGKGLKTICRYCGIENDGDAKYCKSCGKSLI